jgi:NADH:ubiquinone oxidoreductase subunit 3 (subunit A)
MKISIIFLVSLIFIVLGILFVAQLILSEKGNKERLMLFPLESGFESLKPSLTLSSPFFFLAILFVLFDLELILLFPFILFRYSSIVISLV